MRNTGLALIVIALMLALVGTAQAAGLHNVTLSPVDNSNISGMATTIAGNIGGSNPYSNVEINARLNSAPPANMVYQGWLVNTAQNTRTSLGAFNGMNLNIRQNMVSFADNGPFNAIAVSLEPANSMSTIPTTIVAQGNLPGTVLAMNDFSNMAVLPPDEMFQRQIAMQRFGLTDAQITSMRASGWGYDTIEVAANVGKQCNRSAIDVTNMLAQGTSWDQIATTCNTTVASLLTPVPSMAVAGTTQQYGTGRLIMPTLFYQRYSNGRPVVTQDIWDYWSMRGYSWRDVAVAANIAAVTGEDLGDLLTMTRIQGNTWRTIAMDRGFNYDDVTNTSGWPFGTGTTPSATTTETTTPSETMTSPSY